MLQILSDLLFPITLFLVSLALALIYLSWGRICPKCGSWNTRRKIVEGTNDHHPHLVFETIYCDCCACKTLTRIETLRRAKAESKTMYNTQIGD